MSYDDKTILTYRRDASGQNTPYAVKPAGQFVKPSPGGRGPRSAPQPQIPPVAVPPTVASERPPSLADKPMVSNGSMAESHVYINPITHCATPLLGLIATLSHLAYEQDIHDVRADAVKKVREFEWQCGQCGVDEEQSLYARYILCTVLDEGVTKTPWGSQGTWSKQSLLSQFHEETGGGEKFFRLLEQLQTYPAKYINVLELMYICMSLGFEGKYSLVERGNVEIENLRDNLFHLLKMQRDEPERDLSPHWQGVSTKRNTLMKHIPTWVIFALSGVVLLALYSGFAYKLNEKTDTILSRLNAAVVAPVTDKVPAIQFREEEDQ